MDDSTPDIDAPYNCPRLPPSINPSDLIAVVKLHHPDAHTANQASIYIKSQVKPETQADGTEVSPSCTVYLTHKKGDPMYTFGRVTASRRASALDVYIPLTGAGMKQFVMVPARRGECWRIDATSDIPTTVNDIPIQKDTTRSKTQKQKVKSSNPHAVYLDERNANHIEVLGVKIEIWLVKKAYQVLDLEPDFKESELCESLQKVDKRKEKWAKSLWMLKKFPQVKRGTTNSYAVLHRLEGETGTAKLFRGDDGMKKRTREMLMFCRREMHESLVRYQTATTINSIPAMITDTHDGMAPYGAIQSELKLKHPGHRFQAAVKILRSLFSALEFLHFHRIVHRSVDFNSVRLHFDGDIVDKLLLVDYSLAKIVPKDQVMPRDWMLEDSLQSMTIIEDCCDIWEFRKAKQAHSHCEAEMRRRTIESMKWYDKVKRACAVVLSQEVLPGREEAANKTLKKCTKILAEAEMKWSQAQTNELHNVGLFEVGTVTMEKLYHVMADWKRNNPDHDTKEKEYMLLTLGHKFLDGLATSLYKGKWDLTPRDICSKLRSLEGEVKAPWKSFTVSQEFQFRTLENRLIRQCVVDYLAVCCDIYPSWRTTLIVQYAQILLQVNLTQDTIRRFREALAEFDVLPSAMDKTLQMLEEKVGQESSQVFSLTEEHEVVYHVPSDMFNVTQLHKFATGKRLNECLTEDKVGCEVYVEVRGERKLQGHYVPLALLRKFALALGLLVKNSPISKHTFTTVEPADFSEVPPGRIVLARTGLIAFATVARASGQFSHVGQSELDFEFGDPFLPTYFGNMKVLPWRPDTGFEFPKRAEHWAKFKTADELEQAEKIGDRRRLTPTEPTQRKESRLQRVIRNRMLSIAKAQSSKTRTAAYWSDPDEPLVQPKRQRVKRENPGLTHDFEARNPHLRRRPPQQGEDVRHSLPAIDGSSDDGRTERRVALMQKLVAQRQNSESKNASDEERDEEGNENVDGASTIAALSEAQSDDERPLVLPVQLAGN